jgi:ParB-like chromosome segregation protein Spo0J
MKAEKVKINLVKSHPNNPRLIKDDKFKKLVESVSSFPQMMQLRPIVVDETMTILGGNMRLRACIEAGFKEVWIVKAGELTEEQKKEFIIKDNVGFGEWDFDILANEWSSNELEDWGLDIPSFSSPVDYSILDNEDVSEQLKEMTDGVKKAIQIEFEAEHYDEAFALVKFWREQKAYVGGMIMEYLKAEKEKL